eukprot:m.268544 g.268544  ORF g.268544 m.268544 type:complete len:1066 (-) comp16058_c0_seq2:78-3275(-)
MSWSDGGPLGGSGGGASSGGATSVERCCRRGAVTTPVPSPAASTDSATARPTAAAAASGSAPRVLLLLPVPGPARAVSGPPMHASARGRCAVATPERGSARGGRSISIPLTSRNSAGFPPASSTSSPFSAGSVSVPTRSASPPPPRPTVPGRPTRTVPSGWIITGSPPKRRFSTSCQVPTTSSRVCDGAGRGYLPRPPRSAIAVLSSSIISRMASGSPSGSWSTWVSACSAQASGVLPMASTARGSAPAASSAATVSTCSDRWPRWSAVPPPSSGAAALTSQLCGASAAMTSGQPRDAAYCMGVRWAHLHRNDAIAPRVLSRVSTAAAALRSEPKWGTPACTAKWSGANPDTSSRVLTPLPRRRYSSISAGMDCLVAENDRIASISSASVNVRMLSDPMYSLVPSCTRQPPCGVGCSFISATPMHSTGFNSCSNFGFARRFKETTKWSIRARVHTSLLVAGKQAPSRYPIHTQQASTTLTMATPPLGLQLSVLVSLCLFPGVPFANGLEFSVGTVEELKTALHRHTIGLNNVDGRSEISIRAGMYNFNETLFIPRNVHLHPVSNGDVSFRLAPTATHPVVFLHDANNSKLEKIVIVGHNDSTNSAHRRAMAIEIMDGHNTTLTTMTVRGGVRITRGWSHTITRSDITNPYGAAGGHCVYITNAGDPMNLSLSNHVVSHSEVHECRGLGNPWPSSKYPCKGPCPPDPDPNATGSGVMINQDIGVNVTNNYIHDVNYHGVFTQCRLHPFPGSQNPGSGAQTPSALNNIELNHIANVNQCDNIETCKKYGDTGADGACVYFFTYLWGHGQRVVNNFCHQTNQSAKGLYIDGGSSGVTTIGNILWNVTANVIDNNNGHDNHHFANIAVAGYHLGSLTDSNFWGAAGQDFNTDTCTEHGSRHNKQWFNFSAIVGEYFNSPAWKERFPEIQTWFNTTEWNGPNGPVSCDPKNQQLDCCPFPTGTVANYTVMVNIPGECSHENWQNISSNFCGNTHAFDSPIGCWPNDAHFQVVGPQKLYNVDPGFVDRHTGNFGLKPDSKIFKDFPGFPDIPFAKIGPQRSLGHQTKELKF